MAPHQAQVLSLYRRALKLSLDWAVNRAIWRGQALYLRNLFENHRTIQNQKLQKKLLAEGEELLVRFRHPEPYRPPTAPGGTKWERNLPAPILDPPPKGAFDHI